MSKMDIDVFEPSCRELFSGHFKTQDFFFENFFKKKSILQSNFRDFTKGAKPVLAPPWIARALIF